MNERSFYPQGTIRQASTELDGPESKRVKIREIATHDQRHYTRSSTSQKETIFVPTHSSSLVSMATHPQHPTAYRNRAGDHTLIPQPHSRYESNQLPKLIPSSALAEPSEKQHSGQPTPPPSASNSPFRGFAYPTSATGSAKYSSSPSTSHASISYPSPPAPQRVSFTSNSILTAESSAPLANPTSRDSRPVTYPSPTTTSSFLSPYMARVGRLLEQERGTSSVENLLGCYACCSMLPGGAFASRQPLTVRVGCFPVGYEGDKLDRFPKVLEWVWGGSGPGYGDWRITDVKYPPKPTEPKREHSGLNEESYWQESDSQMAPPREHLDIPGINRYWPGGNSPTEIKELDLRRFCMSCGAKAGVYGIKTRMSPIAAIINNENNCRGKKTESEDNRERWVCRCREIRIRDSAAGSDQCDKCGVSLFRYD